MQVMTLAPSFTTLRARRTAERRRERDAYIVFSVLNTLRDIDRHDLLYLLEWESDYLDEVLADLGAMLKEVREASST